MKIKNTVFMLGCAVFLQGCASIGGDNSRLVNVQSKPAGAGIFVDNQQYGVTPSVIQLPNNIYGGKPITVKKPGYQEQTKVVNTKFQPIALLNVLFWPGFIIDAVTGNLVKISPDNTNMNYNLYKSAPGQY